MAECWFGNVPEGWRITRAKNVFTQRMTKGNEENLVLLAATQKYGMIPQHEVDGVVQVKADTDLSTFRTVKKNDFVISLRSFQGGFEISAYEGVCSPAYQVFYATQPISHGYYRYFFKSDVFIQEMNSLTVGIREGKNIQYSSFATTEIPVPPIQEQEAIAAYLDEQCTLIDEAIAEAKASIEEYKVWKVSSIYKAVTKGLNPNAEMRESGILSISDVPFSWRITKILNCLSMPITDGPHTTPELYDTGVPFISAEAVSCGNGTIAFDHIRGYISEAFYQECCKKYIPQIDDVYMIKSGATTGRVAIVDTDRKFTIWSPIAVFRANTDIVIPKFLFYALQSPSYQTQVELGWTYGTQQNIGMRTLETLKICVPGLDEQKEIVAHLDGICNEINSVIREKESLIRDLESYKRSLIYEVVTGKRKVVQ